MRRLRYNVATSLDGFIARPGGEFDWIIDDPTIDFPALHAEFDTAVMGRRTYEVMRAMGPAAILPGMEVIVCSSTLTPQDAPGVKLVEKDVAGVVARLKAQPGRDIWLFGGGVLFRELLDAGLVDTVEVALMPVLLGEGIPVLPPGSDVELTLQTTRTLPSGIVMLTYAVGARRPA
jgi:dihydrofolate reductase